MQTLFQDKQKETNVTNGSMKHDITITEVIMALRKFKNYKAAFPDESKGDKLKHIKEGHLNI